MTKYGNHSHGSEDSGTILRIAGVRQSLLHYVEFTLCSLILSTWPTQTPNMFQDIYESRVVAQNYTLNNEADIAYDAVWALAFALNRTNELVARGNVSESGCDLEGELVPLHMFNYSNALLGCVIRWSLEQTNFTGVSVRMKRTLPSSTGHSFQLCCDCCTRVLCLACESNLEF